MSTIDPVQHALNQHLLSSEQRFKCEIIIEEHKQEIEVLLHKRTIDALYENDGAMLADWIGDNCKKIANMIMDDIVIPDGVADFQDFIFTIATKEHLEMFRKEVEDQFIQEYYS